MSTDRIDNQHFHDQLLGLNADRDLIGKSVQSSADDLVQLLCVFAFERKLAAKHSVEQNAARPNIGWLAAVVFPLDNFRTHIAGSSAEHPEIDFSDGLASESEVDEFDLVVRIDDDILQLDVSVSYFV